jgi:hypothetical protein
LKHAQTCHYYNQVTKLPLSHTVKSFWELHSRTSCPGNKVVVVVVVAAAAAAAAAVVHACITAQSRHILYILAV